MRASIGIRGFAASTLRCAPKTLVSYATKGAMMKILNESQQRRHDMFMAEMQAVLNKYSVDVCADHVGYEDYKVWLSFNAMYRDGGGTVAEGFDVMLSDRYPLESDSNSGCVKTVTLPWETEQ
jgi:NADPH:quinone reductase-like Zn-dependent oxidoreductase